MNNVVERKGLNWLKNSASLIALVIIWELFCMINKNMDSRFINSLLFPAPHQLVEALVDEWKKGYLQTDFLASMSRVVKGFAIAGVIGVVAGVLSGYFKVCETIINPIVELFRPIPALAFLPLFLLWFGIGETSKVAFIAFGAFFNIYVNTYHAVLYTPPILIRAAKCLGASKAQILCRVVLPNAMPGIFTGLRLGFGLALFVLVSAELLAASSGLGFRIMDARSNFNVSVMLAGAFLIGIIGLIFGKVFDVIQNFVLRWVEQ